LRSLGWRNVVARGGSRDLWPGGAVNLPIIHYSVLWWRTLHQGESIGITGSTIDASIGRC
jgi:hypothetical protein